MNNPNNIKLIACDLDGTLINREFDKENNKAIFGVSEYNQRVIAELQKQGVNFTIATGRSMAGVKVLPDLPELDDNIPMITINGAYVSTPNTNKKLIGHPLSNDLVQELLQLAIANNMITMVVLEDGKYHSDIKPEDLYMVNVPPIYNDNILQLAKDNVVYKILLIGDRDSEPMQNIYKQLNDINNQRFICNFSTQYLLEINNPNADKGKALEFVCKHLNIELSEVLCLGDADNDVPMLKVAGVPVVMKNKNSKRYQEEYNIKHVQDNKKHTGVGDFLNEYFNLNVPK